MDKNTNHLAARSLQSGPSITIEINERMQKLKQTGKEIYNLTLGQLPFRPESQFIQSLQQQLSFLHSYQYAPIQGVGDLREKFFLQWQKSRFFDQQLKDHVEEFDNLETIIGHGSKNILFNLLGVLINPGDEVILFSPYWVSFPEMIRFWGGIPKIVTCFQHDHFSPDLDHFEKIITSKTKAVILNSPNNPTGVHYSVNWMKQFSEILLKYNDLVIVSDEVYEQLFYYDPAPYYFYQNHIELLKRTYVVNGISKSLAATGLRIGTGIGPRIGIRAMTKLQGHSTSGANSLVQHALLNYNFVTLKPYLKEIHLNLRKCSEILKETLRANDLSTCWYQTTSAFYFMLDFRGTPVFKKKMFLLQKTIHDQVELSKTDLSQELCEELLEKFSVAIIPGSNFGLINSARLSYALDPTLFAKACERLCLFLNARE